MGVTSGGNVAVAVGETDAVGDAVAVTVGVGDAVAVAVGVEVLIGVAVLVGVVEGVGVSVETVGVMSGTSSSWAQAENSEVLPFGSVAVAVR